MTRKDTILIAVVINAGLLAILFMTAVIYDTDKVIDPVELGTPIANSKPVQAESTPIAATATPSTGDEVDNVLKYYSSPASQPIVVETQPETYIPEPIAIQANAPEEEETAIASSEPSTPGNYIEVTVKKGDVLEKIAKANKSSIAAIKKANQLQSEKLSIGQVLKIPVKQNSIALADTPAVKKVEPKMEPKEEPKKEAEAQPQAVYHVVKSGDNPWKIAKQYGVKDEDILRLNLLDEEKARNLKVGDRIRVK